MNIHPNSFSNYAVSFFKESVLPSLTAQHKKILLITSIVFGLAVCYMVSCYYFKAKLLNGYGKKTSPYGDVEEGLFDNGALIQPKINPSPKKETRTYPCGIVAVGEFKGDELNGQGKKTFVNGTVEEGEFKDDELNGPGKLTFADGTVLDGEFKDGWLCQGKKTFLDGVSLEGEFKNNLLNGKGKVTLSDGKVVEGIYKNGILIHQKLTSI